RGALCLERHRAAPGGDVREGRGMKVRLDWRLLLPLPLLGIGIALIWWRGPNWQVVRDAFTLVRWPWVFAAIGLNLASVIARSLCWNTAIRQAMPPPHP